MDIDLIEIELANYLRSKIGTSERQVVPMPETQAELESPFEHTKITAMFVGEKAQPPTGLGLQSQDVVTQWGFAIQSNKLRGDAGVHKLANLVKDTMNGYKPTDCEKLYYVGHDVVDFISNEWEHRVIFECKSFRVEIQEPEPDAPLLKQVTFEEPQ